mmetsp:Transcript_27147/g.88737  ORF Transcript_27147/g.88737 Transcript_27147/m.88737 type:complete len:217 (-) Transcript_27147:789-1439(-)
MAEHLHFGLLAALEPCRLPAQHAVGDHGAGRKAELGPLVEISDDVKLFVTSLEQVRDKRLYQHLLALWLRHDDPEPCLRQRRERVVAVRRPVLVDELQVLPASDVVHPILDQDLNVVLPLHHPVKDHTLPSRRHPFLEAGDLVQLRHPLLVKPHLVDCAPPLQQFVVIPVPLVADGDDLELLGEGVLLQAPHPVLVPIFLLQPRVPRVVKGQHNPS